ncbi:hypothetical protein EBZ39_18485, partial [bacterium]|nr:hypothetical protein [bacterium]
MSSEFESDTPVKYKMKLVPGHSPPEPQGVKLTDIKKGNLKKLLEIEMSKTIQGATVAVECKAPCPFKENKGPGQESWTYLPGKAGYDYVPAAWYAQCQVTLLACQREKCWLLEYLPEKTKMYIVHANQAWQGTKEYAKDVASGFAADPLQFTKEFTKSMATDPQTYHSAFQAAGMVPGAGAPFDVADAGLYLAQGEPEQAKFSLLMGLPVAGVVGNIARAGRGGKAAVQAAKSAETAASKELQYAARPASMARNVEFPFERQSSPAPTEL